MKFTELYESVKFTMIKLPLIYLLIVIGYILELLVELPCMLMYKIDGVLGKRTE